MSRYRRRQKSSNTEVRDVTLSPIAAGEEELGVDNVIHGAASLVMEPRISKQTTDSKRSSLQWRRWTQTVLELQIHTRIDAEFILCESVAVKASKAGQPKKRPRSSPHFHDCNRPITVSVNLVG
jgi:hypothetical protein